MTPPSVTRRPGHLLAFCRQPGWCIQRSIGHRKYYAAIFWSMDSMSLLQIFFLISTLVLVSSMQPNGFPGFRS